MNALEIFAQAEAITDPDARRRYLDEACGDDAALRARVEEMLGLTVAPPGPKPERDPFDISGRIRRPVAEASDPWIGSTVGGVRIERVIGHGGMGRVYAGVELSTGGTVALKMLIHAVASEESLRRFEQEARLLARLRHPGIAQIHSAGSIKSHGLSIPYFIMEYIPEATPITNHANARNLNTAQRLDLFRRVCEAVAHGHEHGVIHRDLKPANILVDAHGQPKVIDFGVAKCTDVDPLQSTLTEAGAIAGTPAYMSPEQVDGDPDAITVRCDVHALGVVLYELLAGKMPFDFRNALPMGIAQIIRTQEPTPLSSVSRAYRGDLDAIVSKCLEKDRHHRFSGAADLGAEIGRYLAGEAILTRPPGFFGGIVRLARRHRAAAAATLGVAASLVAAVVGISIFAYRAEAHRKVAEEQRDIAKTQTTIAEEKTDAAEKARGEADDYRDKAVEEAANARRRLYTANLFRIRELATKPGRRRLRDLYDETVALLAPLPAGAEEAPAPKGPAPLELSTLLPTINRSLRSVIADPAGIVKVGHSPDGSRLMSWADNGSIKLWDNADGGLVATINVAAAPISSYAPSFQGDRLVTGHQDGTVRVWSLVDGALLDTLGRHEGSVVSVAFSPDGASCASLTRDDAARVWRSDGGGTPLLLEIDSIGPHTELFFSCSALAYSPDGSMLAAATGDDGVRVWRVADGSVLHELTGHKGLVDIVAFSPDGRSIVTSGRDATVRFWDTASGESIAVIERVNQAMKNLNEAMSARVMFGPDGRLVAACFSDGVIRILSASDGRELATLSSDDTGILAIAISPDGRFLSSTHADQTVRVWNVPEAKLVATAHGHTSMVTSVAFSPEGTTFASAAMDGEIHWWDTAAIGDEVVLRGEGNTVSEVRWSGDGRLLASAEFGGIVRLWDGETLEPLGVLKDSDAFVHDVSISPDGRFLATASEDMTARLWDLATGTLVRRFRGHGNQVTTIAFSPDGTHVVSGSLDGTARIWNVATGETIRTFKGPSLGLLDALGAGVGVMVMGVAYSPDGGRIATASADGKVRIWETGADEPVLTLHVPRPEGQTIDYGLVCVAFSPDGSKIAAGSLDQSAWLWELADGTVVRRFEGHGQPLWGIAFDASGRRLVSGSSDKTVRIWDVDTGDNLAVLGGHGDWVNGVDVREESGVIASSSTDGTVRVWGRTNASLHAARLRARQQEANLLPLVREILTGEGGLSAERIDAAAATLPEADRGPFRTLCLREALGGAPIAAGWFERVRIPDLTPARLAALGRTMVSPPRGINFWESPLTGAHLAAIPAIPTLTFLNLGSTGLHAADLRDLSRFPALKTLHLEFLETDGSDLAVLRECPALETISLWKSSLTDAGARVVAGLPRMGHADFGSTAITDAFLEGVEPRDSMKSMRLDHTGLTDAAIDVITRWRKLESVDLTGTAVSAEGIARLREALPDCKIDTDSKR